MKPLPPDPPGTRRERPGYGGGAAGGRCGLGLVVGGVLCFFATALLGPSAMEPDLGGTGPPFSLDAEPRAQLVIGLVAAGIGLSAAGLGLCLWAAGRGWRAEPRRLMVAGLLATAALVLVPPIGSGDHLNYAAYGRMAVTGHDPYTTSATALPDDPVVRTVQEWRDTPSVYGPVATVQQAFASWIGGDSVRATVFILSVTNALAFVLTGWLLYRMCRTSRARLHAVLLWTCNPLMLFHLVAGAHNDALAILTAVAALAVFSVRTRGAAASGLLVGAAAAIKFPAALVGAGPAWTLLKQSRRNLWVLATTAVGLAGAAYLAAGSHAFDQVRRASNSVSLSAPWHLLDAALGVNQHRIVIRIGAVLLLVALIWLFTRALPYDTEGDPDGTRRIAAAIALAWLFSAPYELPWYDGLGWALLALLPWSRYGWALLAHTTALSLAYLPARGPELIGLQDSLGWLVTGVRSTAVPWALTGLLCWVVVSALRPPRAPVPAPARSPRASAGSPG